MSGPGPPAWIHWGSWMSSRVLAHSDGYVSKVTSRPSVRASSTSASSASGRARVRLAVIEVRDVGRRLGPPPDVDGLAERVEEPVAERVAHVGVVEAAVLARGPA